MKVAIIPARGGSKRIPGKNLKLFAGNPIISYSIDAAFKTKLFDRIIVSTDSQEIAAVANQYGAETPFIRPPEISDDHTMLPPVLIHALCWLENNDSPIDYICCILPTAPLINPEFMIDGFAKLISEKTSSVISVTTFPFPISRAFKMNAHGRLEMYWPKHEFTRSNDLAEAYHDAGQFYWLDTKTFYQTERIFNDDAIPVVIPRYLVQDIDTEEDWLTAERMYLCFVNRKDISNKDLS